MSFSNFILENSSLDLIITSPLVKNKKLKTVVI